MIFSLLLTTGLISSLGYGQETVPGYTFLGSYNGMGKDWEFIEKNYYASAASGIWTQSEDDCQKSFGAAGHLISIESELEQLAINKWLQERGSGGAIFWTSGIYDMLQQEWRWSSNEDYNVTWYSNWGTGEPQNLNGRQRIGLNHQNQFTSFWVAEDDSNLERYICEVGSTGPGEPPTFGPTTTAEPEKPLLCNTTNDLIIILDSSGSIGHENYLLLKQFVADLTLPFTSNPENRFALIVYSETVQVVIPLDNSLSTEEITDVILNAPYQAGPTPTDLAINEATNILTANNRRVAQSFLVITDGISNNPNRTIVAANAAVSQGIQTYALGITEYISPDEVLAIAGGDSSHLFMAADWKKLLNYFYLCQVKYVRNDLI